MGSAAVSTNIRISIRICLFLSSISLLFIAVSAGCGWQLYTEVCEAGGQFIWKNWYYWFACFLLLGIVFGFVFPRYLLQQIRDTNLADGTVTSVQDQSYEAVGHAVMYLSLFIAHDCSSERYLWLSIFVISVTLIYCQINNFTLNPILMIQGYRFFDTYLQFDDSACPQRFLVMSKTEIHDGQQLRISRWAGHSVGIHEEKKQ